MLGCKATGSDGGVIGGGARESSWRQGGQTAAHQRNSLSAPFTAGLRGLERGSGAGWPLQALLRQARALLESNRRQSARRCL